ncbi:MAG: recombination protein RecR [Planctomycetes bacterium]|nr:recombination protein RecR [Planctomycetota bacterium]
MMKKVDGLDKLITSLSQMPGIGKKTAQRLAFHIVKMPEEAVRGLIQAVEKARTLTYCPVCFNLNQAETGCSICNDDRRDRNVICVVEQPSDLWALENSGVFHGLYHVLLGHIAHLDNVSSEDLTIKQLMGRVRQNNIKELILATNPTVEGDATALYIQKLLESSNIKVTRLARGIPTGSTIEYASKVILADALQGRKNLSG